MFNWISPWCVSFYIRYVCSSCSLRHYHKLYHDILETRFTVKLWKYSRMKAGRTCVKQKPSPLESIAVMHGQTVAVQDVLSLKLSSFLTGLKLVINKLVLIWITESNQLMLSFWLQFVHAWFMSKSHVHEHCLFIPES